MDKMLKWLLILTGLALMALSVKTYVSADKEVKRLEQEMVSANKVYIYECLKTVKMDSMSILDDETHELYVIPATPEAVKEYIDTHEDIFTHRLIIQYE